MTTKRYIDGVKQNGWPTFPGKLWQRNYYEKLWQRNYYEHIIRDENELNRIREYIINNPAQWEFDRENPDVFPRKHQGINSHSPLAEIYE